MIQVLSVIVSVVFVLMIITLPVAGALTPRNFEYLKDQQCTFRYSGCGAKICGDHVCAPGEWGKWIAQLLASQKGGRSGR